MKELPNITLNFTFYSYATCTRMKYQNLCTNTAIIVCETILMTMLAK